MSGDLEDFLKRAAERRQAKASQQKQSAPQKRVPPQYSDRRTERAPQPVPDAEIVEAQVVTGSSAENVVVAQAVTGSQDRSGQAARSGRRKATNAGAAAPSRLAAESKAKATAVAKRKSNSTPYAQRDATADSQQSVGFSAEDLVAMLKRPGGVKQAFLLREILDRPEHRW
jgi:hypothetical protein